MRLRAIFSAICFIPILALTRVLLGVLPNAKLPKGITVERGKASNQVLAAFICAIFMDISIIIGWLLDRHGEQQLRQESNELRPHFTFVSSGQIAPRESTITRFKFESPLEENPAVGEARALSTNT